MGGRAVLWAAVGALVVTAAACGSSGDKAGGRTESAAAVAPVGRPVTLTLVAVDDLWASQYAAAARRLSGGTIRIEPRYGGNAIVDFERRLVARVRDGDADMASVGARAWDRMGVTSFQALVAPFAIDSLELERRVLEGFLATRALEGVRPLGLVGLAVLPGPLRRPLGLARPLLGPDDYAGATVGIRPGRVAQDRRGGVGATPVGYQVGSLGGLDGAELDLGTIVREGYDAPGSQLTANVVLWARPETIVISSAAFMRLAPAQRQVLRRAGRAAVGPLADRLLREERAALDASCNRGRLTLAAASSAQLASLRAAVRPVTDGLEKNPANRDALAEIRRLRGATAPATPLRCATSAAKAAALAGAWESTVTEPAMLANGATEAEAATYAGRGTLLLRDGHWTFRTERATVTGTYAVAGDDVRLTMRTCTANPCEPGATTEYTWSVYRDKLTLTPRAGLRAWPALVAAPRTRVG